MTAQSGIQLIDQLQNETKLFFLILCQILFHYIVFSLCINLCRKTKQLKKKVLQERKSEFVFNVQK